MTGCALHCAISGIRSVDDHDEVVKVDSPAELPDPSKIVEVREPWMNIEIITPTDYYGPIMESGHQAPRHLQTTGISRAASCAA
jgi:translation elongation factor EF-4